MRSLVRPSLVREVVLEFLECSARAELVLATLVGIAETDRGRGEEERMESWG